jgi:hypothetical protein
MDAIKQIAAKYNIPVNENVESVKDLLHKLSVLRHDSDVYNIGNILNINGFVGYGYGNSLYFGGMRPFNRPEDLVRFTKTSSTNGSKITPVSMTARLESFPYNSYYGIGNIYGLKGAIYSDNHYRGALKAMEYVTGNGKLDDLLINKI